MIDSLYIFFISFFIFYPVMASECTVGAQTNYLLILRLDVTNDQTNSMTIKKCFLNVRN